MLVLCSKFDQGFESIFEGTSLLKARQMVPQVVENRKDGSRLTIAIQACGFQRQNPADSCLLDD